MSDIVLDGNGNAEQRRSRRPRAVPLPTANSTCAAARGQISEIKTPFRPRFVASKTIEVRQGVASVAIGGTRARAVVTVATVWSKQRASLHRFFGSIRKAIQAGIDVYSLFWTDVLIIRQTSRLERAMKHLKTLHASPTWPRVGSIRKSAERLAITPCG